MNTAEKRPPVPLSRSTSRLRRGPAAWLVATGFLLACLLFSTRALAGPGDLDPTYLPDLTGYPYPEVTCMAPQADGKILLGLPEQGATGLPSLIRVHPDGLIDTTFNCPQTESVFSLIVQPDGKILALQEAGTDPAAYVQRFLSTGAVDPSFTYIDDYWLDPDDMLLLPSGKILIAGPFHQIDGAARSYLARLNADGSLDTTFAELHMASNPYHGPIVESMAVQADGSILIGGTFTQVGNSPGAMHSRISMARLDADGLFDPTFQANTDTASSASVGAITIQPDGKILVLGSFATIGGVAETHFARLEPATGAVDLTFRPDTPQDFATGPILLQTDGKIILPNRGTSPYGSFVRFHPDGRKDFDWEFFTSGTASSVIPQADGRLVVGLLYPELNGETRDGSGRLLNNGAPQRLRVDGASRVEWLRSGSAPEAVRTWFEVSTGGGPFIPLGDGVRIPGGWELVTQNLPAPPFQLRASAEIYGSSISIFSATSAGIISQTITHPAARIQVWGNNHAIASAAVSPQESDFTYLGATRQNGTVSRTFEIRNPGLSALTTSFQVTGADAASFTVLTPPASVAAGASASFSVEYDPSAVGMQTAAVEITTNDPDLPVFSLHLQAWGWAANALIDPFFNPMVAPDRNSDELLPRADVRCTATQIDGKILIAGRFSEVGGGSAMTLARLHPGGTVDYSFTATVEKNGAGSAGTVTGLAILPDGKILVAGDFTHINGVARDSIALLSETGSPESMFASTTVNSVIHCLAVQQDGKIMIGGDFTQVNGIACVRTARFDTTGALDTTFTTASNASSDVRSLLLVQPQPTVGTAIFAYIGGDFGVIAVNSAGAALTYNDPIGGNDVHCMAFYGDGLLVGGNFSADAKLRLLSRTTGALVDTFIPAMDGTVKTLALQADGAILVGGEFETCNGVDRNGLVKLSTAYATLDTTFDPQLHSSGGSLGNEGKVTSLSLQADGKILVGGAFTRAGGDTGPVMTRVGLLRLENDPALGTLTITTSTNIKWERGGTAPDTHRVTFDASADGGATWVKYGEATRVVAGGDDWQRVWAVSTANPALPAPGILRARAYVNGGQNNASSYYAEQVTSYVGQNIQVTGNGAEITSGSAPSLTNFTDFGVVAITNEIRVRTFTIANTGDFPLSVGAITKSGTNAALFTVANGAAATVAAGASRNFTVSINPATAGTYTATLSFTNSDPQSTPFVINLKAVADHPEIEILGMDDSLIADGTATASVSAGTDFGYSSLNWPAYSTRICTIRNLGPANLIVTGITRTGGTAAANFSVSTPEPFQLFTFPFTVPPGESHDFAIHFDPTVLGLRSTNVNVLTNDVDEATYNFFVSGIAASPEIEVYGKDPAGNDVLITDGDTTPTTADSTDFGSVYLSIPVTRHFTVKNSSQVALIISESVGTPFQYHVPFCFLHPHETLVIPVTFASGVSPAVVNILSDDPNEATYNFTVKASGISANREDPAFSSPRNNNGIIYTAMPLSGQKVLVGGTFSYIDGDIFHPKLALLNSDGSVDGAFTAWANGAVRCTAQVSSTPLQPDGSIVIAGAFTGISGQTRNRIARLDASGNLDSAYHPDVNGEIYCMAVCPDNSIYISGAFTQVDSEARTYIAKLGPDGELDTTFVPDPISAPIYALALLPNGQLMAGGSDIQPGLKGYCRLNMDGTIDSTLPQLGTNTNTLGDVYCISVQNDGEILLGGSFTYVGATQRNRMARLNTDGTLDMSFNPNASGDVFSIGPREGSSLSIHIAGNFLSLGGQYYPYFAGVSNSSGWPSPGFLDGQGGPTMCSLAHRADGAVLLAGDLWNGNPPQQTGVLQLWSGFSEEILTANTSTGLIEWSRNTTASKTSDVTFELSTDGGNTWEMLGTGTRVGTKWQLTYSLPSSGHICARARIIGGMYNGSSALVEKITSFGTP